MLEHIQETKSRHSSRRSSRHSTRESPPAIPSETHEPSEDPPVRPIGPQDRISDPIPSPRVQSTVPSPATKPATQPSTDERDRSLEDALAKSRTERLARANIQGAGSRTPTPLKSHEETVAPASTKYLRDAFQRVLDYISLHPQEPGDPPQRPAPRIPRAHPLSCNLPQSYRYPSQSTPTSSFQNAP